MAEQMRQVALTEVAEHVGGVLAIAIAFLVYLVVAEDIVKELSAERALECLLADNRSH